MKRENLLLAFAILTTPQVPRLGPDSIAPSAINPPRAQAPGADSFGAGFGEGLQKVGRTAQTIMQEERDKVDRTAAIESRTKLDQAEVDLLYHPKDGALAKRGKDSFSLEEPTLAAFDTRTAEIEKGLTTPVQKEAFRLLKDQRRVEVDKQVQRHVFGEMKTYAEEANKASLESTLNNVSMHYQDPDRVEGERKFGLAVIMSDTANKGLPPEAVKMKAATWDSMVHRSVIDRLSVDNPVKAKEYFDANRDRLLPTDAAKIENTLKPLAEAQEGLDAANTVFYGAGEKTTLAEMLKSVHDTFPNKPGVVKHAEGEIRSLYTAREAAQKQVIEEAENTVYSAIAKVKLAGGVPKRGDVPAEAWAALAKVAPHKVDIIASEVLRDQEHAADRIQSKEDRAQAKIDRDQARKDREENRTTVDSLTTWGLLKTNPAELGKVNLDKLLATGKIKKAQYQDLVTDQLAIKQGKGEHEAKILSDKAAVDSVLASVKITDKKDPEKYMKFYSALDERMKAFQVEHGSKPKQEDVLKMSRGLLGEVSQDVNFWPVDKTVRVFEADTTKVRVPSGDRAAIVKALQTNKRPVTEETIRSLYLERQKRNGGAK